MMDWLKFFHQKRSTLAIGAVIAYTILLSAIIFFFSHTIFAATRSRKIKGRGGKANVWGPMH